MRKSITHEILDYMQKLTSGMYVFEVKPISL